MIRYQTLQDLVKAYQTGELSEREPLVLDNDQTAVYQGSGRAGFVPVYEGGDPGQLLREALTLLGIPWEEA